LFLDFLYRIAPNSVNHENESDVFLNLYGNGIGVSPKPFEFELDTPVRISSARTMFDKATMSQGYTLEVFRIYIAIKDKKPFASISHSNFLKIQDRLTYLDSPSNLYLIMNSAKNNERYTANQ
jgi:hypothetical protein